MRIILITVIVFSFCMHSKSQNHSVIDSLFLVLKETKEDTNRVWCLLRIGDRYEYQKPDTALFYYNKALKISEIIGSKKFIAKCNNYIGVVTFDQGNYDKASNHYLKSLEIFKELGDKKGISGCLMNMGSVHFFHGNYDRALEYYFESLKVFEEQVDRKGMTACYTNIGSIYQKQFIPDKAIENYHKALRIYKELGNKKGISSCYSNIGAVNSDLCNFNIAIENYQKALEVKKEIDDKNGMSICYNNLGNINKKQGNYDKAIGFFIKALELKEEMGDKNGLVTVYNFIASLNVILSDSVSLSENQRINYLNNAVEYANKAFELAKLIKAIPGQNDAAHHLQIAFTKLGKYKEAIEYAEIYNSTQDSMFSEDKTNALAEMGTKYESEKKELEIEKMKKQKELDNKTIEAQQAENRKQLIIIVSSVIGFLIVLIFSIVLLRMFRQKRKANLLLAEQKAEIEEKNRDILDSITYAKRIQLAILPPNKVVKEYLKDSFILYKPKDIVAGDFYWMEHSDGKILFAAADCTGHGVSGAMVSVVCNNGLNRAVREHGLTDPGQILDKTREIVIQEFEKSEEEVKDGMDIALCSLEGNKLQYAGAHNPLWIIRNEEILETKPNRQPIGMSRICEPFATHTIELQRGDTFYIFSDGYVDQFGGEKSKKFKSKAFKELLLSIQDKTMGDQRTILDESFETWKGKLEQIDDVCIIGVRI